MLCLIKNLLNYMQTIQSCLPGFVVSVTVRNYKQTYLSALQSWSKVWLLQFNIAKCKILRLGSNPPVMTYSLEAKDGITVALEESKCERDLGVLVDNELKFGQQVDAVVLKANRQLGLIKRSFTYLDEKHWCCCTRLLSDQYLNMLMHGSIKYL